MRLKILALLLVLFLPIAGAFGSFPVDHSKRSADLEADFRLGFVNPGGTAARAELSAPGSLGYNVSFPRESFTVEPTRVSRNPEGENWYYLGGGRYTQVRYVDFTVTAERSRESNRLDIPVTVTASGTEGGSGGTSSNVVYVRQHVFELELLQELPGDDGSDPGTGVEWIEVGNETGESGDRAVNGSSDPANNYKPGGQSTETGGSGVDGTTLVLLAAVIVMAVYTYRVA